MPDFNGNGIDDVEEVNSCLLAKGLRFTACAWRALWKALDGVKTLFCGSTLFFIGLIDEMGGVDLLQSLKTQAGTDDPRLGKWLMGLIILFLALRFLTKGPMFKGKAGATPAANPDDGETATP